ncbi:MAG: hypothetical protein BLITH_0724 [Brockia lithotrophica]|uniref:Uncharacterized protein n=1 Tax=Brockia lithotrophica TaxID=933949 RepID=A0A2T5G8N0_9BACL|nr:MAG: hypothetical protein BLITH_0724 [Brockia lithotrophica]
MYSWYIFLRLFEKSCFPPSEKPSHNKGSGGGGVRTGAVGANGV